MRPIRLTISAFGPYAGSTTLALDKLGEAADVLRELADDLAQGCPMDLGSCLFDDDWDQKYIQGMPIERGYSLD